MIKQTITNVRIADFDDDRTTISVTAESNNKQETFHVQTSDGRFRTDLGCFVITDTSDGDIDQDDYPDFDISEIISEAEDYIQQ